MVRNIFIVLLLMNVVTSSIFPDDSSSNLRIGVVLIENPDRDPGIESLCETATGTIELTLRLVNKYTVERVNFLTPEYNLERARFYFKNNGIDNAVFGEIKRSSDGEYLFSIKGWERKTDSIVVQTEERSDSVFDMFDIVDNITIKFIEELSGEHIGFGKINFINKGVDSDYKIYVDGNYIGKNLEERDILYGERVFKITTPGQFGDTVVDTVTIDVEENGEHDIVFSMGEAAPVITSSDSNEGTAIGNLFIESDPVGSEVFLDNQSIGFTPLSLYGVGAGLYDLQVASEYYVPTTQVLRLEPNIDNKLSFDLGIDVENPDIKKQLKDPSKMGLLAGALALGQIAWWGTTSIFTPKGSPVDWWYLDYLIMSPRYGQLLAGDEVTGTILSLANLFVYLGFSGTYDGILGEKIVSSQWDDIFYTSALIGLLLYDMIFTPSVATQYNKKLVESYKKDGVSFDKEIPKSLRYVIQVGGGGVIHGGATWAPFWNWLWFEQLVGVSLTQYVDILKPALSGTTKIYAYPFSNTFKIFRPYMGGLLNISSNFNSVNTAFGLTSGFDIDVKWFDLFIEADLYIGNSMGTVPNILALGVRL